MNRWLFLLLVAGLFCASKMAVAQSQGDARSESPRVDAKLAIVPDPHPPRRELDVDIYTDKRTYTVGDSARISFKVNKNARVAIFSTDTNGETRQIFPNYWDRDNYARAGRTYSIPRSGYSLRILPPAGSETVTILATTRDRGIIGLANPTENDPFPRSSGAVAVQRRSGWRDHDRHEFARDTASFRTVERGSTNPYYGSVRVETVPSDVQVWIDDTYYGTTPVTARNVMAGWHTLRLTKHGYIGFSRRINVAPGETLRFHERLQANPSGNLPWGSTGQNNNNSGGGYYWY